MGLHYINERRGLGAEAPKPWRRMVPGTGALQKPLPPRCSEPARCARYVGFRPQSAARSASAGASPKGVSEASPRTIPLHQVSGFSMDARAHYCILTPTLSCVAHDKYIYIHKE